MAKPSPTFETRTARSLYLTGSTLMAFGLCWGFFVPYTPFPKLALTAHIQCMVEGMMILLSGMLVEKTDLVKLSETQATIVWAGMVSAWPVLLTECMNSWWGTNGILPIAAASAGAKGGLPWQELIVTSTHMIGGLGMVATWTLLSWALFQGFGKGRDETSSVQIGTQKKK